MKKLVTLFAGVVLVGGLASIAGAQAAGPTGGGVQSGGPAFQGKGGKQAGPHAPINGKFLKQLNLTPDQQKQIKDLVQRFREKVQQEQQTGQKPNRKENVQLRKQFMEDLSKILTPEQREKLKQLMEEAKEKRRAGLGGVTNKPGTGIGTGNGVGTGTGTGGGTRTGGGI